MQVHLTVQEVIKLFVAVAAALGDLGEHFLEHLSGCDALAAHGVGHAREEEGDRDEGMVEIEVLLRHFPGPSLPNLRPKQAPVRTGGEGRGRGGRGV